MATACLPHLLGVHFRSPHLAVTGDLEDQHGCIGQAGLRSVPPLASSALCSPAPLVLACSSFCFGSLTAKFTGMSPADA